MENISQVNNQINLYSPKLQVQHKKYHLTYETCMYIGSIAAVAICRLQKTTNGYYATALPFKIFALRNSIQDKSYRATLLTIISLGALCFPKYRVASIAFDVISAGIATYRSGKSNTPLDNEHKPLLKKPLDPKKFSNACKILGIKESDSANQVHIQEVFTKTVSALEKRKAITEKISPFLAKEVQGIIDTVHAAYKTLANNG